jgi:F-type H+-transporting ATPase subunit a
MRNRILTVLGVIAVIGVAMYFLGFRMSKEDLHISAAAEPLFCIGGTVEGEFCSPGTTLPITNSVLMTVLVDLILIGIAFGIGQRLQLVPRGLQNIVELVIEFFYDFARGVDAKNVAKFFPLPATIFVFFLVANMLALVPGVGSIGACVHNPEAAAEAHAAASTAPINLAAFPGACDHSTQLMIPFLRAPAADLNVTFAFALAAGIMIEFFGFQALGLGYLGKFFVNPFKEGPIQTFVGLLELLGEFTRILAFAFRIFGNIFGGEVVLAVMTFLFAYLLPLPFYGLELFVAFIQAVIFAVLTTVFSALAVQSHGGHDDHATSGAAAH